MDSNNVECTTAANSRPGSYILGNGTIGRRACLSELCPPADPRSRVRVQTRAGRPSLRNKSSNDVAFPHPKSRKQQHRKKDIPDTGRVVVSIRRRIINVAEYRNATDDVNPAKNRSFGRFFHHWCCPPPFTISGPPAAAT